MLRLFTLSGFGFKDTNVAIISNWVFNVLVFVKNSLDPLKKIKLMLIIALKIQVRTVIFTFCSIYTSLCRIFVFQNICIQCFPKCCRKGNPLGNQVELNQRPLQSRAGVA